MAVAFPFLAAADPVSETGLPLPRFASLKSDEVNMRAGPGQKYPVKWTYRREDYPVKIINEYQQWRQVEDAEGVTGWMHKTVLSGRRTGLIAQDETLLLKKPIDNADTIAKLMKGVIVDIENCRPDWCEIEIGKKDGWVPASLLWGSRP